MAKKKFTIHKLELDDDGFKNSYLDGKFSIDCTEITFTQNGVSSPKKYTSAGHILVSPQNGAEAHLICVRTDESTYDKYASLKEFSSRTSGKLIPESNYYSLIAKDISGKVWTGLPRIS